MNVTYEVIFVSQQENGNYDVFVNGRKNLEAKDIGYQPAIDRAKTVLNNMGGGYVIVEYLDKEPELINCYK